MPITFYCPNCGAAVETQADPGAQVTCAICQKPVPVPPASSQAAAVGPSPHRQSESPPSTGMAIAALVCGIAGIVTCIPIAGIVGVVLGIIALVRAGNRPREYGGKGMAIAGICTGSVSMIIVPVLLISILLPSLSRARELAKRAVCAANMRGIGQSLMIYANNNAGEFPPNTQLLIDVGLCTPKVFQCPSEGIDPEAGSDFQYIAGLNPRSPGDWIVLCEDPANHNGEGGNLLYVDMHVEFIKEPAYNTELERVNLEMAESGSDPGP